MAKVTKEDREAQDRVQAAQAVSQHQSSQFVASSLARVMGTGAFNAEPGLAAALASGNASDDQLVAIAQFTKGLQASTAVQLARQNNVPIGLSQDEKRILDAMGVPYHDVDSDRVALAAAAKQHQATVAAISEETKDKPESEKKHGGVSGFFEKAAANVLGGSVGAVKKIPAAAGKIANDVQKVSLAPFRAADVYADNPVTNALNNAVSGVPVLGDLGQYMNLKSDLTHGENDTGSTIQTLINIYNGDVYDGLSVAKLRQQYGDTLVNQVKAYTDAKNHGDPNNLDPSLFPADLGKQQELVNSPEFQRAAALMDSAHISPGRDLARNLGIDPAVTPEAFHIVSGAADAAVDWFADPTIVGGKIVKARKLAKLGLNSMVDADGVERAMNTPVMRDMAQRFLDDAEKMRTGTDEEKLAAQASLRSYAPAWEPIIPEVQGQFRVMSGSKLNLLSDKTPIRDVDEFIDYMIDQNVVARINMGKAARETPYMPGYTSKLGLKIALAKGVVRSKVAVGALRREQKLGLIPEDARLFPTPGDAVNSADVDTEAVSKLGEATLNYNRYGTTVDPGSLTKRAVRVFTGATRRQYWQNAVKRVSTLTHQAGPLVYDATNAEAPEQIRRFALAGGLTKTQANLIKASFQGADTAGRRQIVRGLKEQVANASGLMASQSGSEFAAKWLRDDEQLMKQVYSTIPGLSTLVDESGTRTAALWTGQLNNVTILPSFKDLHRLAANTSMWDFVSRKALEGPAIDAVLAKIRPLWLMTWASAGRNSLEDFVGFLFTRGPKAYFTSLGKTRSDVLKQKIAVGERLKRSLDAEIPESARADVTDAASYHREKFKAKVRLAVNPGRELRVKLYDKLSQQDIDDAAEAYARGVAAGRTHELDDMAWRAAQNGSDDPLSGVAGLTPDEIANAGYSPQPFGFELDGWRVHDGDTDSAMRFWAHNLNQRFGDDGMGQMILNAAAKNDDNSFWDAVDHLLHNDRMAQFRASSEFYRPVTEAGKISEAAQVDAAADLVHRLVDDMNSLVRSGTSGKLNTKLAKYLSDQNASPSIDWLSKIDRNMRPAHVVGRSWIAKAPDNMTDKAGNLINKLVRKGYDFTVSKPINAMTRHPIFHANFTLAYKQYKPMFDKLVNGGIGAAEARKIVEDNAWQRARYLSAQVMDNPNNASQFAMLTRNLFNFTRATEDFVRRWIRLGVQDVSRLRKAQLVYDGMHDSGLIYKNEDGESYFVYPASGFMMNTLLGIGEKLGIPDAVLLPVVPNLTSKVEYVNAGLSNPYQLTVSPVVSTPIRVVGALIGQYAPQYTMDVQKVERVTMSERGVDKAWYEDYLPSTVTRFLSLTGDDSAQLRSATMNAIANLEAGGHGLDADATPEEVDQWLKRVQTGAKSQLFLRSVFAWAAPASPSQPTEDNGDDADPSWQAEGVRTLKDEYRTMINKWGYDRAMAVWTELHPDKLAYTVGQTETAAHTPLSATAKTQQWMSEHVDVLKKYAGVSAYFVPDDNQGQFNQSAYNAEKELGLRNQKTLEQFYSDVRVADAEDIYWDTTDKHNDLVKQLKVSNPSAVQSAALKAEDHKYSQWRDTFLATNPLFWQKLKTYSVDDVATQQHIAQLRVMLSDPDGRAIMLDPDAVAKLVTAYDNYNRWYDGVASKRDKESLAQKSAVKAQYQQFLKNLVDGHPSIKPVYNGLFREGGYDDES